MALFSIRNLLTLTLLAEGKRWNEFAEWHVAWLAGRT